jgi:hypothetical protein
MAISSCPAEIFESPKRSALVELRRNLGAVVFMKREVQYAELAIMLVQPMRSIKQNSARTPLFIFGKSPTVRTCDLGLFAVLNHLLRSNIFPWRRTDLV